MAPGLVEEWASREGFRLSGDDRSPPTKKSANRSAIAWEPVRRPLRAIPTRNPVHRAKEREREELGVALREDSRVHAFLDDAPHACVKGVAPRDHRLEVSGGQCFEVQKERRSVQFVDDRVDEGVDQASQLDVGGRAAPVDLLEQTGQPVERILVAGEEDLFLVLEVVVEIPLFHV